LRSWPIRALCDDRRAREADCPRPKVLEILRHKQEPFRLTGGAIALSNLSISPPSGAQCWMAGRLCFVFVRGMKRSIFHRCAHARTHLGECFRVRRRFDAKQQQHPGEWFDRTDGSPTHAPGLTPALCQAPGREKLRKIRASTFCGGAVSLPPLSGDIAPGSMLALGGDWSPSQAGGLGSEDLRPERVRFTNAWGDRFPLSAQSPCTDLAAGWSLCGAPERFTLQGIPRARSTKIPPKFVHSGTSECVFL
jgi:hypothetical protein